MLLQNYPHLQYSLLFNENFSTWHYAASNNGKMSKQNFMCCWPCILV